MTFSLDSLLDPLPRLCECGRMTSECDKCPYCGDHIYVFDARCRNPKCIEESARERVMDEGEE